MFFKRYAPWVAGTVAVLGLIFLNLDLAFYGKTGDDASNQILTSGVDSPQLPDWVKDPQLWQDQNEQALSKYHNEKGGREEGAGMLAELLRWNWSTTFGVNLAGVDVGEIFTRIKIPDSEVNLLEYLGSSSARSGSFLISFAQSNLSGAVAPSANIRGISFAGAGGDTRTWESWMRIRDGRGLEGCNLLGVNLQGVNIHGVILKGANLDSTGLKPDFSDGLTDKLDDTRLNGVSFLGMDLEGVSLRYCNLKGSEIDADQLLTVARSNGGSGLRGAVFPKEDLTGKDVSTLTLQFSDLSNVKMSEDQVKTISGQWNGMGLYGAQLPSGMTAGRSAE